MLKASIVTAVPRLHKISYCAYCLAFPGKSLRVHTSEYFNDSDLNESYIQTAGEKPQVKEGERPMDVLSKNQINYLRSDIKVFLNRHGSQVLILAKMHILASLHLTSALGQTTTGRQLARIFHGLPSPRFPATEWEASPFWRRHREVDFNYLIAIANEEIVAGRSHKEAER